MTVLFGFLNPLHSSWKPKVASGKQEEQYITLCVLKTFVREGFLKGEHSVSIFLDLEKPYDTT